MRWTAWVVALAATLQPAATAAAAEVSVEGGVLRYVAAPGEINEVDVTYDPGYSASGPTLWIMEYSVSLTAGPGCAPAAPNVLAVDTADTSSAARGGVAACPGASSVEVVLGDGNDRAYSFVSAPLTVHAGDGADLVWSGPGEDVLDGGGGHDRLLGDGGRDTVLGGEGDDVLDGDQGEPGGPPPVAKHSVGDVSPGAADVVDGGPGDDLVIGGGGPDVIRGGAGHDRVDYGGRRGGVTVTLGGGADDGEAGEGDAVTEVEHVRGTPFADVLAGTGADELLQLGAGDDRADGGGGRDRIEASAGDDRLESRDDAVDTLICGSGSDTARVDAADEVTPDCDTLDRPPAPARYSGVLRLKAVRAAREWVRISGALQLAPSHLDACRGARVDLTVTGRRRTATGAATLGGTCRFAARVRIRGRRSGMLRVVARVPDSPRLVGATAVVKLCESRGHPTRFTV